MKTNDLLERIKKLRPIDDLLFEVIIKDRATCEEILRVILQDKNLTVLSVTPQSSLRNLYGRSVRLDAFCRLGNGKLVNIEVQKSNSDDQMKRVRYNEACITSNNTKVGDDFVQVPDVIMVYISDFDIFKKGLTIYHCRTYIEETKEPIENGLWEVYVNATVHDGSEIAELMECFKKEQFEHKKFPLFSHRMKIIKTEEEEMLNICGVMGDFAREIEEKVTETVTKEVTETVTKEVAAEKDLSFAKKLLLQQKLSLEEIASVSELSMENLLALKTSLIQSGELISKN